jgi:soluble lytic murein transglycosylase-like protein
MVASVLLMLPALAEADLVYFASGRALSVRSLAIQEGRAVLALRGGGEVVCDAALIARVESDEVPWPEPVARLSPVAPVAAVPAPFDHLIEPLAVRYGIEAALVRAVVDAESAFEPRARSRKGAMGLMQLMPQTARQYAVGDPYEPSANLEGGIRHLKFLLDRYDMRVALAAYNAGEATVRRHGGVPPFRETRDYVDRVLQRLQQYRLAVGAGVTGAGVRQSTTVPSS